LLALLLSVLGLLGFTAIIEAWSSLGKVVPMSPGQERPTVSINDVTVTEGNTGTINATFTVTISRAIDFPVAINYLTANGTATLADNDYVLVSGFVNFGAGQPLTRTINVPVNGDTTNEPDERFFVNLTTVDDVTILDGQGVCTILNDDSVCAFSISPTSQNFSSGAGMNSVSVTAPDGCNWSASSNSSWITIESGASGSGAGTVNYRVEPNGGILTRSRTGIITIANKAFIVSQDGTSCEFSLRPASMTVAASGGTHSFQVNAPNHCEWEAIVELSSTGSILSISSGSSGRGNGMVSFSVPPNFNAFERHGGIRVSNRRDVTDATVFALTQEASDASNCTYAFSPIHQSFDPDAGTGEFLITTQDGCSKAATSNVDWINVKEPAANKISYSVQSNPGSFRSGTISVGTGQFVVYQDPVGCPQEFICHFFPSACMKRANSVLSASREFRDKVLAETSRGQNYTRLYYHFAREAVQILALNPLLILRSSEMMQKYKPVLESIVKGERVTFTQNDIEEIDSFLNVLAEKGSAEMRESIKGLCEDLRNPQVQSEFNITVVQGEKQNSSSSDKSSSNWPSKFAAGFVTLFGFCAFSLFGLNKKRRRKMFKGAKVMFIAGLALAISNVAHFAPTNASFAFVKAQRQKQFNNPCAKLPLTFEPNLGQANTDAKFIARGDGYALSLKATEAALQLRNAECRLRIGAQQESTTNIKLPATDTLRMKLVGANPSARIEGVDKLIGMSNYLIGNDASKWREGVANYSKVKCVNVYNGVDVIYYGNGRALEYDFKLAAGADYKAIALEFDGAESIKIDAAGDLVIRAANGEVCQHKPIAYQELNGTRKPVACNYLLLDEGENSRKTKSSTQLQTPDSELRTRFELGEYDKSLPLVIDPVLAYSTYLGGNGTDEGTAITTDSVGNLYVVGLTTSANFPTANASQPTSGGGQQDAFIAKLNPSGTALLYSTYIGGDGQETASSIAVDSSGNAYVTGFTGSTNFPAKEALQAANRGSSNAFVMKLNAAGALTYSTLLGGSANDTGTGIAVDSSGNFYVAGITTSPNFPMMNATQNALSGAADGFVAKFNASGNQLLFSTYLGGTSSDAAMSLAIDSSGNLYLTGVTTSRNLPTVNALQQSHGGGLFDGFVAKLNPTTNQLVYLTYLGGSGEDRSFRIAVDVAGNAYVAGDTDSSSFPTANPFQRSIAGVADGFISKLNPTGTSLVYSTYLGGSGIDGATAVAVNAMGEAYVTGFTASDNFPILNHLQGSRTALFDAFVTKLNAEGNQLDYSTYLGGSGIDAGFAIAVDVAGNAYVMGQTDSINFPTANPVRPAYGGGTSDVFISKIPATTLSAPRITGASISGKKLIITGSGFDIGAKILVDGQPQKTVNDPQNPATSLTGKKAGRQMGPGQTVTLQVQNSDAALSPEFRYTRPSQ